MPSLITFMGSNSQLLRPQSQQLVNYERIINSLIDHCSLCPSILALIRHGSFPGDIGISDIDVIIVIDDSSPLDLSTLKSLKSLSYLLDIMYIPISFIADLPSHLSLSNPSVLYTSNHDYDSLYNRLVASSPPSEVLFSESFSAYLHKYACLLRLSTSNIIDLRKILLCTKSILRSINFIGFTNACAPLYISSSEIHSHLRSNNQHLSDSEIISLVRVMSDNLFRLHPATLSKYSANFSILFQSLEFKGSKPVLRGTPIVKSPMLFIHLISYFKFSTMITPKFFYPLPKPLYSYACFIKQFCSLVYKPSSPPTLVNHIIFLNNLVQSQAELCLPISFHSISRFL